MMKKTNLQQQTIEDWRWQIVQERSYEFDGVFFFGVSSTKIYCKPSCAARRPKPENIFFFDSGAEAENSGFRACLRCRPAENAPNANAQLVVKVCAAIERDDDGETSLEQLAAESNVSQTHLQRAFKQTLGISPREFADAQRIRNFKKQVRQTDVTTAMYQSGFGSSRALYEKSTEKLGMTPATYRKGGKNLDIKFTTADSKLGKLLVAQTEKGVCAVAFGNTNQELEANLAAEFPAANLQPDESGLQAFVRTIVEYLDENRKTLNLPLDLQATAFQMRVWSELRRIPYGETRSYKQIAERLGNSKAVRAVARACATNSVALINPCHRVIGANGNLSGFRWGIERKKRLLDSEQSIETDDWQRNSSLK